MDLDRPVRSRSVVAPVPAAGAELERVLSREQAVQVIGASPRRWELDSFETARDTAVHVDADAAQSLARGRPDCSRYRAAEAERGINVLGRLAAYDPHRVPAEGERRVVPAVDL